jgi:tRNA (guanine37-N1)-methyltransferase
MRIEVVTLFPGMITAFTQWGVISRAIRGGVLELASWNPREFTHDPHRTVDDRPFGGGPGMVMMVQPLRDAIRAARAASGGPCLVIYLSPQGKRFDQRRAGELAESGEALVLVAGRYEGIDERVIETEIDEELSIGDYVLSGGELAAAVVIEAVARLLPGALGDEESARQDSFASGLLDHPQYTRPREIDGLVVPEVLLGGNHREIEAWRAREALERTRRKRPDLVRGRSDAAGGEEIRHGRDGDMASPGPDSGN